MADQTSLTDPKDVFSENVRLKKEVKRWQDKAHEEQQNSDHFQGELARKEGDFERQKEQSVQALQAYKDIKIENNMLIAQLKESTQLNASLYQALSDMIDHFSKSETIMEDPAKKLKIIKARTLINSLEKNKLVKQQ